MPRTKKIPEPTAETSGITSVKDKEKEIQQVIQPPKPEKKRRVLSEEQKKVLRERLEKARAVRKANLEKKKESN